MCFESESSSEPEEMIPLEQCTVHSALRQTGKSNVFEVRHPALQSYFLLTTSDDECREWIGVCSSLSKLTC